MPVLGAAIGAGAGLIAGTAIGADNARRAASDVERAYGDAYYACMGEADDGPDDADYADGPPPGSWLWSGAYPPPALLPAALLRAYYPYPYYPYYGPGVRLRLRRLAAAMAAIGGFRGGHWRH